MICSKTASKYIKIDLGLIPIDAALLEGQSFLPQDFTDLYYFFAEPAIINSTVQPVVDLQNNIETDFTKFIDLVRSKFSEAEIAEHNAVIEALEAHKEEAISQTVSNSEKLVTEVSTPMALVTNAE